jgi:hypothetical protein
MYDRESLYRYLYSKCDQNNVIAIKQGEIAKEWGMSYQRLSGIMKEFVDLGMVEKIRHKWVCLYDPDKIPWDRFRALRKEYMAAQRDA